MLLTLIIVCCLVIGFAAGVAGVLLAGVTHCDDCE